MLNVHARDTLQKFLRVFYLIMYDECQSVLRVEEGNSNEQEDGGGGAHLVGIKELSLVFESACVPRDSL